MTMYDIYTRLMAVEIMAGACTDSKNAARSFGRIFGMEAAEKEFYMVDLPLKDHDRGVVRVQPYPIRISMEISIKKTCIRDIY